jgi:crotonobetainyl-CoA:carnitine CoA-transferase CaiB-like acyl-CoA transferase
MAGEGFDLMETMGIPLRTGPTVARLTPFGVFPARTGEIAICAPTDTFANGLFHAMGQPELANDPRFATRDARVEHAVAVDARISEWTRERDIPQLIEELQAHGVPSAAVRGPREAVRDPRVLARHECVPLEHPVHGATAEVYGMGVPIRFSAARAEFDQPPPAPGQHNREVYGDLLGYSDRQIAELSTLGVI